MSLVAETAERLFNDHRARRNFQSIGVRPEKGGLDFAYDVQDRLVSIMSQNGNGKVAGYKIGLTTPRMQKMCGIDHPIAGAVLSRRVHRSPFTVRQGDFVRLGVECELAVRLARAIDGGKNTPDLDEIRDAIGAVAAAFELVEDRAADYKALDLISLVADNSWNGGIVLGPEAPAADIEDIEGVLEVNGAIADRGRSSDVHWILSGDVILMTLLGGSGTIFGPVVGAVLITSLEEFLAESRVPVLPVIGTVFVLCILFFRRGIVGEISHQLMKRKI
jgi:2-keto-4-pentenoate hydratase